MNALTKFLGVGGNVGESVSNPSSRAAPPAAAPRLKLTEQERQELLEILRDSELVTAHIEGAAAADEEARAHLVAEIEQLRRDHEQRVPSMVRELSAARSRREKLEQQLREVSDTEAELQAALPRAQAVMENAVAVRQRQLEDTADPRIDAFRQWVEREQQITRNHAPAFTQEEYRDRDGELAYRGTYDPVGQAALKRRSEVLRRVARRLSELKVLAISGEPLANEIDELQAQIDAAPIPTSCSKVVPDPRDVLVHPIDRETVLFKDRGTGQIGAISRGRRR